MKKKINFDPTAYAYMDTMPLLGWIWEFERRSEQYRNAYAFRQNNPSKENSYKKGLVYFRSQGWDPDLKWNEVNNNIKPASVLKYAPVKTANLKWKDNLIPHSPGEERILNGEISISYDYAGEHPVTMVRDEFGRENVVMALIDISANQRDINEALESQIDLWRKKLKIKPQRAPKKKSQVKIKDDEEILRKNSTMWKAYFIVYDLIGEPKRLTFKKVSYILQEFGTNYSSEKNISNYYKEAKKLINGIYKEYL